MMALSGLCLPAIGCIPPIAGGGSGVVQSIGAAAASAALGSFTAGLSGAAVWIVGQVAALVNGSVDPQLGALWFKSELGLMEDVVLLVVLPVLMIATIGAVLHQDSRRLTRIWGVGLPLALFAGAVGSQLVGLALSVTDGLCAVAVGNTSGHLVAGFASALVTKGAPGPPFVQMIVAGLAVVGAVLVWLELTLRAAGVYIATFFMPLALIAYIWPATAGTARRFVEILGALVGSKFVIVASLGLGFTALTKGGAGPAVSGAAVLLMAAFAPFALLRLAPVVETAAIAHLEGLSRRPARAAARVAASAAGAPGQTVAGLVAAARHGFSSERAASADRAMVTRPVMARDLPYAAPSFVPTPDHAEDGEDG